MAGNTEGVSAATADADIDIGEHVGLVHALARRHRWAINAALDYEDLVAAGMCGLHVAAKKYDAACGAKFATYATYVVNTHIRNESHRNASTVRHPYSYRRSCWKKKLSTAYMSYEETQSHTDADYDHLGLCEQVMTTAKRLLSDRDLQIFRRRVLEDESLKAIGDSYGITGECVRQIVVKATGLIRKELKQSAH